MRTLLLAALLLWQLPTTGLRAQEKAVTVFAAASLTDAMKDISELWVKAGHPALRNSFASSSTLARQIEAGAPADLFASADLQWMDYLQQRQLIVTDTRRALLANDLVLIVPADKPVTVAIGPGFDLAALLGANGRLATGDPQHVPVGIYAEQALKKLDVWAAVQPKLARTEDVRSALLLVERGEAPAGIVYGTDAAASKGVAVAGVFPADSHDPVVYPFAVTKTGDGSDAKALMAFLQTPAVREVFVKRGFKVQE